MSSKIHLFQAMPSASFAIAMNQDRLGQSDITPMNDLNQTLVNH